MHDQAVPQLTPQDPYEALIAAGVDPSPLAKLVLVQAIAVLAAKVGIPETQRLLRQFADTLPIVKPQGNA